MKTSLVLCLITTLSMVITWGNARLHEHHHDNNAVVEVLDKKINPRPCMKNFNSRNYTQFRRKHILDENLNNANREEWRQYLVKKGLCGRQPVQSFFKSNDEATVKEVCKKNCFVFSDNLCVSLQSFTVFHVKSTDNHSVCMVTDVWEKNQKVILACDAVNEKCLPVHYEK